MARYWSRDNIIFNPSDDIYSCIEKASSKGNNIWSGKKIMAEKKSLLRRIFRRSIWENASTVLILLGVFMLMQPFAMWMYTYSFIVILVGTIGFVITSHFPD